MPGNSTSSSNYRIYCTDTLDRLISPTTYIITRTILVSPLCILILHLARQRWLQQRSFSTTSHSDIFTYHIIAQELIIELGSILYYVGVIAGGSEVVAAGVHVSLIGLAGQMAFHVLTCVERYLAVVHPVLYLRLRNSRGVKIRNVSAACAWLVSFVWSGVVSLFNGGSPNVGMFVYLVATLAIITFCSLRLLCVLIRPGPGGAGRDKERMDQMKRRALFTITAISTVLWVWFAATLVGLAFEASALLSYSDGCLLLMSLSWFSLPSNLVQPLLYLHRAGKLGCCN